MSSVSLIVKHLCYSHGLHKSMFNRMIEKYSHLYDKNNLNYDKIKIQNLWNNIYCILQP